jgi:transcriptional regulator with XRE-family HTH domain
MPQINNIKETTAAALKAKRESMSISQQAIGDTLKIGQSRVSEIESGKMNLTLDAMQQYASALGCEVEVRIVKKRIKK